MTLARRVGEIASILFVVAFSATLAHRQMKSTKMLKESRSGLARLLDGTAERPFAFRVLVPILLRGPDLLPKRVVDDIEAHLTGLAAFNVPSEVVPGTRPIYFHGLFFILTVALAAFAFLTGEAYLVSFDPPAWFRPIPQILAILSVIPFMATDGAAHTYDFLVLATAAGLLYALVTGRPSLFVFVFFVGCLNKETTLLAIFPFVCCFWDRFRPGQLRVWFLLLLAVGGLTQGLIHFLARHNAGTVMEHWGKYHVQWIIERSFTDIACALALAALVFRRWSAQPALIRRATILLLPLTGLYFLGGAPGEQRVFYDALPLLAVLAIRNLQWFLTDAFLYQEARTVTA